VDSLSLPQKILDAIPSVSNWCASIFVPQNVPSAGSWIDENANTAQMHRKQNSIVYWDISTQEATRVKLFMSD
jgi:hypothetical protein